MSRRENKSEDRDIDRAPAGFPGIHFGIGLLYSYSKKKAHPFRRFAQRCGCA
jgi:hypothetical protein